MEFRVERNAIIIKPGNCSDPIPRRHVSLAFSTAFELATSNMM